MIIGYRFREIVSRAEGKCRCTKCGKVRKRVFKKGCYDNGLHILELTRRKNQAAVSRDAKAYSADKKFVCNTCLGAT